MDTPARPAGRGALRTALLAVIAIALVALGGGLAVALGIGRDDATTPSADSVDVGFARDMAIHHVQGVEMANLALDRSIDPEVRGLAFDIAETQNNQAGRMQGWLALWGVQPTGGERMAWMAGGHRGHDMPGMEGMPGTDGPLMPGMATEAELAGLRDLSGPEFDVEFLRLMIRHHEGGVDMARAILDRTDRWEVRRLAQAMVNSQQSEITVMQNLLARKGATAEPGEAAPHSHGEE